MTPWLEQGTDSALGQYLGNVRVNHLLASGQRDRDAVVTVLDEVQAAKAVHLDRGNYRPAPFGHIKQLPPLSVPVRGRTESTVELARLLDGPDHRVQPDGPQAYVVFPAKSQDADHVAEPQQARVVRFAAQPAD